jgi:serine protease DegQ
LPRGLILAVCGALVGAAPLFAADVEPEKLLEAIQQQVQAVFEKSGPAVARIEATNVHGRFAGTGFFIDPNGTLYTSYSVGGESQDITVHFRGERLTATRLISDSRSGIAILKVDAQTPFLTFGKARDLSLASPVIALGFPVEMTLNPSFGIVGGFDVKHGVRFFSTTHIRANVPVQNGEFGAPLLNTKGEAVGIIVATIDRGSGAFVLPIEAAEKVRMDFIRFREVRPGWIGLAVKAAEAPAAGSTARIEEVTADSPAQKAGLLPGDILLQIGAQKITIPDDVLDASFFLTADDEVPVRIARGATELQLQIQPADPPTANRAALPDARLLPRGLRTGQ